MQYYKCSSYKYLLAEDLTVPLTMPFDEIEAKFFSIKNGHIFIKKGYAWDGASGPTIDTKNSMVPALVHDCLYQAIRLGLLPKSARADADKEFYTKLRERKMFWLRAKIWYLSVRYFAAGSATPGKLQDNDVVLTVN